MTTPGFHTYQEILSQPDAWTNALDIIRGQAASLCGFFKDNQFDQIIYTGCGSTYYLSLAAAAITQQLVGLPTRGLPASEIWLYPCSAYPLTSRTLLVTVSRSGETTETIRACEAFRSTGGKILSLTGYPSSPLATLGDLNLVLPTVQEESVAQTRAFSTLYLATVALAAMWSDKNGLIEELVNLPHVCKRLIEDYGPLAKDVGSLPYLDRFYFLGSGPRYGLGCELSLKMKEMSLSHSEPFHFFEFRHGPKSMVTPTTLVLGLVSEAFHGQELDVLSEMRDQGARVLSVGDQSVQVAFGSGMTEYACNVLCLPFGQLLAYYHAISKGLDPDQPHNLTAVVKLSV